ncbi:hypothetical protein BG418_14405 [Streptomyces sp. CBMA152]|nr:hypothetical protein [Streptomyces sp. CBMA152]
MRHAVGRHTLQDREGAPARFHAPDAGARRQCEVGWSTHGGRLGERGRPATTCLHRPAPHVVALELLEVSVEELRLNVDRQKLDALVELISAIRSSHDEIDAWLAAAEKAFPVIQDHGFGSTGAE